MAYLFGDRTGDPENDRLFGTSSDDKIYGYAANDWLRGEDGDDELFAGIGNDILEGGAGNDILWAEAGSNSLYGGSGSDILYSGSGADYMHGGSGIDLADFRYVRSSVDVDLAAQTARAGSNGPLDRVVSIENVVGTRYGDDIRGDDTRNQIWSGDGNDRIEGRGGDDYLRGGFGRDTVSGGAGNDRVMGDGGDDLLVGHVGNDILDGGAGADKVSYYYLGPSRGVHVDLAQGVGHVSWQDRDTLIDVENAAGSPNDDILVGDNHDNRLYGNGGDDVLSGGAGNDYLWDIDGNNIFAGGRGDDYMQGGFGVDIFVFEAGHRGPGSGNVSYNLLMGDDKVRGFGAEDRLDFRELDWVSSFSEFMGAARDEGYSTVVEFAMGDSLTLLGVDLEDLSASQFIF